MRAGSAMLCAAVAAGLGAVRVEANDDVPKKAPAAKERRAKSGSAARKGERFLLWRTDLPQVGNRSREAFNVKADLVLRYMRRGKPLRVETARAGHELEYVDEVLEVNGPIPSRVMRTYRLVHDWSTGEVDKEHKQVLLSWTPQGFRHEVQGKKKLAKLADQYLGYEKESKEEAMAGVFDRLLPHQAVPVGHRWTIPDEVGEAMAGVKLEDLDRKKTRCRGYFLAVRWGKTKRRRYMRIAFRLRLYVTKLCGFSYADEPALLEITSKFWVPADGARGKTQVKIRGKLSGKGGTHPKLPKDITAKVSGSWEGDVENEPVRQGKF